MEKAQQYAVEEPVEPFQENNQAMSNSGIITLSYEEAKRMYFNVWKGNTMLDKKLKESMSKFNWTFVAKATMNSLVTKPVNIGS